MITITLNWAVAAYISLAMLLVLSLWIFYNYHDKTISQKSDQLVQCLFCGHLFFNYLDSEILSCPLCKSYIDPKKDQRKQRKKNNENIAAN
ncbi:MAG: hypothetical protein KBD53_05295 [Candidatus Omnitrophica bacterium]|nr:hypothetical protein [Candidatus Omnitrophota bacterium]